MFVKSNKQEFYVHMFIHYETNITDSSVVTLERAAAGLITIKTSQEPHYPLPGRKGLCEITDNVFT